MNWDKLAAFEMPRTLTLADEMPRTMDQITGAQTMRDLKRLSDVASQADISADLRRATELARHVYCAPPEEILRLAETMHRALSIPTQELLETHARLAAQVSGVGEVARQMLGAHSHATSLAHDPSVFSTRIYADFFASLDRLAGEFKRDFDDALTVSLVPRVSRVLPH
jgi:hypothetical protein